MKTTAKIKETAIYDYDNYYKNIEQNENDINFLEENLWNEVILHGSTDELILVSKYEQTKKYSLPIDCIQLESQEQEQEYDNVIDYSIPVNRFEKIKQHSKKVLLILLLSVTVFTFWRYTNNNYSEAKTLVEIKQKIIPIKNDFEILNESKDLKNNVVIKELQIQKKLRDEIKEKQKKINNSIQIVQSYKNEISNIDIQLIRLAQ